MKKQSIAIILVISILFSLFSYPLSTIAQVSDENYKEYYVDPAYDQNSQELSNQDNQKQSLSAKELGKTTNKPIEIETLRTRNSRQFLNPDGSFTLELYNKAVFAKDTTGQYKEIDNNIVTSNDANFAYQNKLNKFEVKFSNNNKKQNLVRVELSSDKWLEFTPTNKQANMNKVNGNTANYLIDETYSLEYKVENDKVKESIVLSMYPGTNQFDFSFKLHGLNIIQDEEQMIWLTDADTGKKELYIEKPFAVDADGNTTMDAEYKLTKANGLVNITVEVDNEWLKNAKYPVIVDPTLAEAIEQPGPVHSNDTFVSTLYPNTNYAGAENLYVGNSAIYWQTISYIQFNNLPTLSSNANIEEAYIVVKPTENNATLKIHQVGNAWDSKTLTYNTRPNPSADTDLGMGTYDSTTELINFNITNLAKAWYFSSTNNYGVKLTTEYSTDPVVEIVSGDHQTLFDEPKLVIKYRVEPLGYADYWTYHEGVNLYNGNLTVSDTDISIGGKGLPLSITRTYNSRLQGDTPAHFYLSDLLNGSPYGYGWNLNYNIRLYEGANKQIVTMRDSDASVHFFTKYTPPAEEQEPGVTYYRTPDGLPYNLTKRQVSGGGHEYIITSIDGTTYQFFDTGRLSEIKDTYDNRIRISYNASGLINIIEQISYVNGQAQTDSQKLYLNYTNGKLNNIVYKIKKQSVEVNKNKIVYSYGNNDLQRAEFYHYNDDLNTFSLEYSMIYEYDLYHNLIKTRERYQSSGEVNQTEYTYYNDVGEIGIYGRDRVNQIIRQFNGDVQGSKTIFDYTKIANESVTKVTDPKGITQQYTFNAKGNAVKSVLNPLGENIAIEQAWDANNNLLAITYPGNKKVEYAYDGNNDLTRTRNAISDTLNRYDNRLISEQVDYIKNANFTNYNTNNRLQSIVNPLSSTSFTTYNQFGNVTEQTDYIGKGDNLVANSSFEKGSFTNWEKSANVTKDNIVMQYGSYSAHLNGNDEYVFSDFIPVNSETFYNLSLYFKTKNLNIAGRKAFVKVHWYDANNNWLNDSGEILQTQNADEWLRKMYRIKSNINAKYAKIGIKVIGTGEAWIDAVQLEQGTVINQTNILNNESFEDSQEGTDFVQDWIRSANLTNQHISVSENAYDKNVSLKITGAANQNRYFRSDEIKLEGNKDDAIIVSGWSKPDNLVSGLGEQYYMVEMEVFYKNDTSEWSKWYGVQFDQTNENWQYRERLIRAEADYYKVRVHGIVRNKTGSAYFDKLGVRRDDYANAVVTRYNLIQNGSFERGIVGSIPQEWAVTGTSDTQLRKNGDDLGNNEERLNTSAISGNHYMKISNASSPVNIVSQEFIPIEINKTYTIKAAVKSQALVEGAPITAIIKYDLYGSQNDGDWKAQSISDRVPHTDEWTWINLTMSGSQMKALNPAANFFKVSVATQTALVNSVVYYDTVKLITEPVNSKLTYDTDHNLNYIKSITNPLGKTITMENDDYGQVKKLIDPKNYQTTYSYDGLGRLKTQKNAKGLELTYQYNMKGNLDNIANNGNSRKIWYVYNEYHQVTSRVGLSGNKTEFAYDKNGNLNKITQPDYDMYGNPKTIIIEYLFDGIDRLKNIVFEGITKYSYSYDAESKLSTITDNENNRTTTFQYDQINRINKRILSGDTNETTNYIYNANSQLKSITNSKVSVNPIQYIYDSTGLNIEISDFDNNKTFYMHDQAGNITKQHNGTQSTYYQSNAAGQIENIRIETGIGTTIKNYTYTYDDNGNIKTEHESISNTLTDYEYNNINELETEKRFENNILKLHYQYQYDLMGNRLQKTVQAAYNTETSQSFTYDLSNRHNNTGYSYDARGNLLQDKNYKYEYDEANRLKTVKRLNNTLIAKYKYDQDGLRTEKQVYNESQQLTKLEKYHYAGSKLSHITDGNNNILYSFVWGSDGKAISIKSYGLSSTHYYRYNVRGDVIALTDSNGNIIEEYKYDAYGNLLNNPLTTIGNINPLRYAGYFYDVETKNYYLEARYYNPDTGRFLTEDPIESINLYVYANNNPVTFVDGNGENPVLVGIFGRVILNYSIDALIGVATDYLLHLTTGASFNITSSLKQNAMYSLLPGIGMFKKVKILNKLAGEIKVAQKAAKGAGKGFKNYSAKEIERKFSLKKGQFHQIKQDIIRDLTKKNSRYKNDMKTVGNNPDIHLSSDGTIRIMSRDRKTSFDTSWNIKNFLP